MSDNFITPKEDPKKGDTTIDEIINVAKSLIELTRQKILINLRFFDVALASLKYKAEPVKSMAMNGETLFYNPLYVISHYNSASRSFSREMLHVIMHCVLKHNINVLHLDPVLWNLACDIAVEDVIYGLEFEFLDNSADMDEGRRKIITKFKSEIKTRKGESVNYLSAETVYRYLKDSKISDSQIEKMNAIFEVDDHILWYIPDPEDFGGAGFKVVKNDKDKIIRIEMDENSPMSRNMGGGQQSSGNSSSDNNQSDGLPQNNQGGEGQPSFRDRIDKMWSDIAERMKIDLETMSKDIGTSAGSLMQNIAEVTREKYDYTSFLKKFAVRGEVMKINDDEFDYVFYTYGLKLYGKVPLIEPLEYKEEKRIKEFAIIIDTSGSVMGKEVQAFLNKTYNILKSEESFHKKVNIHIIQCDAEVQEDHKITTREEFDEYLKVMKLKGFGGTDFRPALSHVEDLIEKKEFTNLKGVIYFTDCYGTFPDKKPPFETAFVVVTEDNHRPPVPSWAIRLELKYDDLQN